jgi:hypothetical protein
MKATEKEKIRLSKTLLVLLNELEEECLKTIKLSAMLKMHSLTYEQMEDLIGELSASVTHLKVHSEQLEHVIEKELDEN